MKINPITKTQFLHYFKNIENSNIWQVIHPADGWLIIDLGIKYTDTVPGRNGQDQPYERGEYQIFIRGDWKIYKKNKLFATRQVKNDNQKEYFDRMEQLTNDFPINKVKKVSLNKGTLIISGEDAKIKILIDPTTDTISLSKVKLDANKQPLFYYHYGFAEKINGLAVIEAQAAEN